MDIDVSRVKRTRGGHEVRIYATDGSGEYQIHGAYKLNDQWHMRMWRKDGVYVSHSSSDLDLVEEPRTIELDRWLNVYPNGDTTEYLTKENADAAALKTRFACINIKRPVTEGEGL